MTAVATDTVIGCHDLRKTYGAVKAVDGVTFEVRQGEIFGLLGPNGAGKTTTVEMLEGLRSPDGGSLQVLGIDVAAHPDDAQGADRGRPPDRRALPEAHGRRGHRPLPELLPALPADRAAHRVPRPRRAPERAHEGAVGRAAAAARRRARAGQRSGGRVPRRTDDRPRPGRPALAVGPRGAAQGPGQDDPAHDALHGRGRSALRPAGDHGPRPHHRDGHRRRGRQPALQGAGGPVRPDRGDRRRATGRA